MIDAEMSDELTVPCTRSDLRRFGLQLAGMLLGVFFVLPWVRHGQVRLWPCWTALALFLWAVSAPQSMRPLHQAWTLLGRGLGAVNSRVVLGVMFFVIITPLGLVMRLCGRDMMGRKRQPSWDTYRINRQPDVPINMQRLF